MKKPVVTIEDNIIKRDSHLVDVYKLPKELEMEPPKDKFHLTYITFLFFGLGSFLPLPFFVTANDYWMYKFRNISLNTVDAYNRTALQANFISLTTISYSMFAFLTTAVTARYGHRINIRKRLVASMTLSAFFFVLFTGFIKMDTDTWQVAFLVITLAVYSLTIICSFVFFVSNQYLMARFPKEYLKARFYGQNVGGILSASLQILSLSLSKSSAETALYYFCSGTIVILTTAFLAHISKYNCFYNYYIGDTDADTKRGAHSWAEIKDVSKKIWPFIALALVGLMTAPMAHPNITSLIVSEGYGKGHSWNDKYFVPVVTFLIGDVCSLIGNLLATPIFTKKNASYLAVLFFLANFALSPLFLFCNALPRENFPVWFPHDWQYIAILCVYKIHKSFVQLSCIVSTKSLAPGQEELAFLLMMVVVMSTAFIASPLGTIFVNIL